MAMAIEWFGIVKEIPSLLKDLGKLIKNNRRTKDLLLRELKLNIKSFETAFKSKANYDKLAELLSNDKIKEARNESFNFNNIKKGKIELKHVRDERNKRYIGKTCEWLFKNIDEKIEELKRLKKYHSTLENIDQTNISLQFSNLFYKMKLLIDFIK